MRDLGATCKVLNKTKMRQLSTWITPYTPVTERPYAVQRQASRSFTSGSHVWCRTCWRPVVACGREGRSPKAVDTCVQATEFRSRSPLSVAGFLDIHLTWQHWELLNSGKTTHCQSLMDNWHCYSFVSEQTTLLICTQLLAVPRLIVFTLKCWEFCFPIMYLDRINTLLKYGMKPDWNESCFSI